MTTKIGVRELSRNSNVLDGYDYVEIEDKKTHEFKGLYVSAKYADDFKKFLDLKIEKEYQDKIQKIMKYAGKGKIDEKYNNLLSSEIKEKKEKEKHDSN